MQVILTGSAKTEAKLASKGTSVGKIPGISTGIPSFCYGTVSAP